MRILLLCLRQRDDILVSARVHGLSPGLTFFCDAVHYGAKDQNVRAAVGTSS